MGSSLPNHGPHALYPLMYIYTSTKTDTAIPQHDHHVNYRRHTHCTISRYVNSEQSLTNGDTDLPPLPQWLDHCGRLLKSQFGQSEKGPTCTGSQKRNNGWKKELMKTGSFIVLLVDVSKQEYPSLRNIILCSVFVDIINYLCSVFFRA